jgi:3-methyl-2-oxobutanoate hydroxymethyltransferase
MSAHSVSRRLTHVDLAKMKATGEKIAMLTCYDAGFAQACNAAGVDSILVGDSLGMVVQGHDSTLPVTVEHIAYHVACVVRGCQRPQIIADLPFGSFQESPQVAYRNSVTLMAAGAQMVKLEQQWTWPRPRATGVFGIPVAPTSASPQSVPVQLPPRTGQGRRRRRAGHRRQLGQQDASAADRARSHSRALAADVLPS